MNEVILRAAHEAILEQLMQRGWVESFVYREDVGFAVRWTQLGRERCEWIRTIDAEVDLLGQGSFILLSICRKRAEDQSR